MAVYYFWTASGNWNVLSNWSTAQNLHTIPTTLPSYSDRIAFESGTLGGLSSAASSTVTNDFSCSAIVFSTGYTGSVTMSNAVVHVSASQAGQFNLSNNTIISASGHSKTGFRVFGSSSIFFGTAKYQANLTLAKTAIDVPSGNTGQGLKVTHNIQSLCPITGNLYLNDIAGVADPGSRIQNYPMILEDITGTDDGGFEVNGGYIYLQSTSAVTGSSFIKLVNGIGSSRVGFVISASADDTTLTTIYGLFSNGKGYGLNIDAPGTSVDLFSTVVTSSFTAKWRSIWFYSTAVSISNGNIVITNSGSALIFANGTSGKPNRFTKSSSVTNFTIPILGTHVLTGGPSTYLTIDQSDPFLVTHLIAGGSLFGGESGTSINLINTGSTSNTPIIIRDGQVTNINTGITGRMGGTATVILTGSRGALYRGDSNSGGVGFPIIIDCNHFILNKNIIDIPSTTLIPSGSIGGSLSNFANTYIYDQGPSIITGSKVQTWETSGSTLLFTNRSIPNISTKPIIFDQVVISGSGGSSFVTLTLLSELSASGLTVMGIKNTTFIPVGGGFQVGTYDVQTPGITQSFGTSSTAPAGNTYIYDFNITNNFLSSGSQASPITYQAIPVNAGRSASLNLEVGASQAVTWSLNRDVDSGRGQGITSSLGGFAAHGTAWTSVDPTKPNSPYLSRYVNWYAQRVTKTITVTQPANGTVNVGAPYTMVGNVVTYDVDPDTGFVNIPFSVTSSIGYKANSATWTNPIDFSGGSAGIGGSPPNQSFNVFAYNKDYNLSVVVALDPRNIAVTRTVNGGGSVNKGSIGFGGSDNNILSNSTPNSTNTIQAGFKTTQSISINPKTGYYISILTINSVPEDISTLSGGQTYTFDLPINGNKNINVQFTYNAALLPTGTTSSYTQLALRYCLGSDNKKENWYTTSSYRSQHPNQNITNFDSGDPKVATFHNFPTTISYYNPIVEVHSTEWPDLSGNRSISNKIRVDSPYIPTNNGDINLYKNISVQKPLTDNQPPDTSRLGVYFSPTNEVNQDIAEQFGGLSIDDYIGDPSYLSLESYPGLQELYFGYFKKYGHHWKASGSNADVTSSMRPAGPQNYIRLLKHYDASLFKLIKKFIPYRANAQVGLVIEPHLLSRSKIPTKIPTYENLTYSSSIDIPEVYTPGGFVQDGDGEPFRDGPGYVEEAVVGNDKIVNAAAEVLPIQLEDTINTQIIQLSGNANEYNNNDIDDQPSGYDVGDRLYDEIDFGITSYGRDARVEGSQYVFMTYTTSGSGNNVSEPYLITSSRYDYHEAQSPVIMDSRRSEIANVTNNVYDTDVFFGKAFQDYTVYSNDATPSTITTYTSSNAIWENNWTSHFGLTFDSLITASVLQPSPFSTDAYWSLDQGLKYNIKGNNAIAEPVTASLFIPSFFYNNKDVVSKDYIYKIDIIAVKDASSIPPLTLSWFFGNLNSSLSESITLLTSDTTYSYVTKATGNYLGLKVFTEKNTTLANTFCNIKSLKIECLNYRANVQDFHLQDSYGMRNARYDGCKLTATDYNVDSTDTVDGGPVIQITVGGGNELIVRPGNKGVFTTQTLLKSGQAQIKKKGGLGSL